RTLVELLWLPAWAWSNTPADWLHLLRLPVSGAAFAAAVVFYIRWNDVWFRRHAREEFWLNRLNLDVSRASFLVEMALEWKDDTGAALPLELVEPIARGLFAGDVAEADVARHPADDLASKLLGATTELNIKGAGVEARLDRKAIDRFQRASKDT